jgi:hypothetical protein
VTFEEGVAELGRLEALARNLSMSDATFERIALEVTQDAHRYSVERIPAQTLAEIRHRIEPPRTRMPGAPRRRPGLL